MNIEETLEQMAGQTYPKKVDVVEGVMATVSQRPYLRPVRKPVEWRRISTVAAAAVAVLFVVGLLVPILRPYDNEGMGSMIAQVNDYSSWGMIEEGAINPIECLYIDDEDF